MVQLINTGLLELLSSFKMLARLHLIWCNKFMSSHLSCNMLQSTFSRSLTTWQPTHSCSSLPVTACTIRESRGLLLLARKLNSYFTVSLCSILAAYPHSETFQYQQICVHFLLPKWMAILLTPWCDPPHWPCDTPLSAKVGTNFAEKRP
jgi:hypothetical protein